MEIKEYTKFRTDEILPLYTQVGWTAYTEDKAALEHGFQNSLLILAAYEKDALLGLIRVVGDGATVIFVQDILVYPEKQRQGIGTALLKAVLDRYAHVRQIQLVTDNTPAARSEIRDVSHPEGAAEHWLSDNTPRRRCHPAIAVYRLRMATAGHRAVRL